MKFLVLRKKHFWEKTKEEKIGLSDIEIEILYITRINKKIRRRTGAFDSVLSCDFKEFFKEADIMRLFAQKSFDKIVSRHGGVNRDILEVQADILNEENAKILTSLALDARYVIVHSDLSAEHFDFLCEEAGVCPELSCEDFSQNLVVYLGEDFLIKHLPTGKTYYDVVATLPEEFNAYFLPEGNMIFSEYIKANPSEVQNVKIRELMSK